MYAMPAFCFPPRVYLAPFLLALPFDTPSPPTSQLKHPPLSPMIPYSPHASPSPPRHASPLGLLGHGGRHLVEGVLGLGGKVLRRLCHATHDPSAPSAPSAPTRRATRRASARCLLGRRGLEGRAAAGGEGATDAAAHRLRRAPFVARLACQHEFPSEKVPT